MVHRQFMSCCKYSILSLTIKPALSAINETGIGGISTGMIVSMLQTRIIIIIIIINYFYNAHNTLQGMSLCAVRKNRLGGGGTVQVHDIIEIIQIGRFLKQT